MNSDVYNPSLPFIGPLPGTLQPGNLIKVSGAVGSSAACFSVNLQNGSNSYQRSDIALHLSPVFTSPPRLVRNSLENQHWGPEESHGPPFLLTTGQGFEIFILADSDHFKIAVNGQHFTEFHYRLPLQSITHIAIDGEVTINSIKFEGIAKSPMASFPGSGDSVSKPLGFVVDPNRQGNLAAPPSGGRPASPYNTSLPYPPTSSFGPSPTSPYAPPPTSGGAYPPNSSNPYNPYPSSYNPYGPQAAPQSGRVSPSPYGQPASNPYNVPHSGNPYPNPQGYPQGYPSSNPYPAQPGPYPGTSVVYPGQEKKSEGGMNLGPLAAAGAAALAGVAGSTMLGGKHKKKKHGHGVTGMLGHGAVPGALMGGVSSLLGGNKHGGGHKGSSPIPIGGAVAGGAAALAGAYMLSKSPMGKMMKPKKMKKLYKHKHKGWGSSSSSSSSD